MPVSKQEVPNRPLNGQELRQLMIDDFTKLLDSDAMFMPNIAYRRAAFTVGFRLQTGNVMYKTHTGKRSSINPPKNETNELKKSLEAPPLQPPVEDKGELSLESTRTVENPNVVRIEHGMPITVNRLDDTGRPRPEGIVYPQSVIKEAGEMPSEPPKIEDKTGQDDSAWGKW